MISRKLPMITKKYIFLATMSWNLFVTKIFLIKNKKTLLNGFLIIKNFLLWHMKITKKKSLKNIFMLLKLFSCNYYWFPVKKNIELNINKIEFHFKKFSEWVFFLWFHNYQKIIYVQKICIEFLYHSLTEFINHYRWF